MPANREILALLTDDELLIALDFYELTVPDRRVKDDIVEVLATSPEASIDDILDWLPRDQLKALCREFGLDLNRMRVTNDVIPRPLPRERTIGPVRGHIRTCRSKSAPVTATTV